MVPQGNDGHTGSRGKASSSDRSGKKGSSSSGKRSSAWRSALRDVAPYLDLGWRLAGTTAGPPVLGLVLDLWLGTIPWLLLGGCVFGLAGAVLQLKRLQGDLRS